MEESDSAASLAAISDACAQAVERVSGAVVAIHARHRFPSSGVATGPETVVTAAHTIKREEEIAVTLPDGRTVSARLAGRDPGTDLAVLKLEGAGLSAVSMGDTGALKVGHLALAVGRGGDNGPVASLGVISMIGGPWRTRRGGSLDRLVRLDVALYPGFSGGPLLDARGAVMGINTSGLTRNGGLVIPASTVTRVVEELLRRGHVAQGYLGVGMYPVSLPASIRSRMSADVKSGLLVISVEPDGPADRSGLLLGDILYAFDDRPLADTDDVQAALGPERVGKALKASIIRGGAPLDLQITVGERPSGER